MSSNPFRRSRPVEPDASSANIFSAAVPVPVPVPVPVSREDTAPTTPPKRTKKKKRVHIQTPPHSPDVAKSPDHEGRQLSAADSAARAAGESEGESMTTGDSDPEHAPINTRGNSGSLPPPDATPTAAIKPPSNPFARTLASSDMAVGLQSRHREEEVAKEQRRLVMDVDMFKDILMGSSAVPAGLSNGASSARLYDSGSSTDTSSIFDPAYGPHPESPRRSYEEDQSTSDNDEDDDAHEDERSGLMGDGRLDDLAPPAPPKPKRGPQTVSFADFDQSIPPGYQSAPRTPSVHNQHITGILRTATPPRSNSHLNKPLPPPPQTTSDSTPPTVPDKDIPAPITDVTSAPGHDDDANPKKVPPPPPTSRRQPGAHSRERSVSNLSNSGSAASTPASEAYSTAPKIDEAVPKPAPPPPPSRKPHPVQQATTITAPKGSSPGQSAEAKLVPAPPPRRNPSKSGGNANNNRRASVDSITLQAAAPAPLGGAIPPPPPPRRERGSKRASTDGPPASLPRRLSGDNYRAASLDSERSASISSLQKVAEAGEAREEAVTSPSSATEPDILADMAAFQAEIDALRAQDGTLR